MAYFFYVAFGNKIKEYGQGEILQNGLQID
jgi:hypothetical protein